MITLICGSVDDNKSTTFTDVLELALESSMESPATQLVAKVRFGEVPPSFGDAQLWYKNKKLFAGRVDRQTTSFTGKGNILVLEARCSGRLLLDNEAQPETLWGANLATIFARHASQYKFTLVNEKPAGTLPVFTIGRGTSQWEVFREFAQRLHGVRPYVVGNQIYVREVNLASPSLVFDNGDKNGLDYTQLAHTKTPYNLISRVYLKDELGQYSTMVDSSLAGYYGVERRRYATASSDLLTTPQVDANGRIKAAVNRFEEFRLVCPELLAPKLGGTVSVTNPSFGEKRLIVYGYEILAGKNGVATALTLKEVGRV